MPRSIARQSTKLALTVEVLPDLPVGHGDERRLPGSVSLVGNAIKFTDTGEVAIKAAAVNGSYTVSVRYRARHQ